MTRRDVCGTVVKVALGAAAGVGVVAVRDASRDQAAADPPPPSHRAEALDRPRAPTVDELARLDPSTAPLPCVDTLVPTVVTRVDEAMPIGAGDDELARLREQVAALEREVERLRAQLADGSPRRHALRKLVASNELRHGRLYEELLGLIVDDPEGVTEDPRRVFETIVRLIDETGLAGASREDSDSDRCVAPEPTAQDLRLTLGHSANDERIEPQDGAPHFLRHTEQVRFRADIVLPKAPEGWLGQPLVADVSLEVEESDRGTGWIRLSMDAKSTGLAPAVTWSLEWHDDEAYLNRSPWRGSDESRALTPADVATERGWVDRIFRQLLTRAR